MLRRKRIHGFVRATRSKRRGIKRFAVACRAANGDFSFIEALPASDKELVRFAIGVRLRGLTALDKELVRE
jgi:hypothetical protein